MTNCWEYMKCGREASGINTAQLGECPAFAMEAGDACWLVTGTFCEGEVQGTHAQKIRSCMSCGFYKQFDFAHRAAVRARVA